MSVSVAPAPYAPPPEPTHQLAGWWRRVGGSTVDALVLVVPFAILGLLFGAYQVTHTVFSSGSTTVHNTSVNFYDRWFDHLLWFAYALALLTRRGRRNGRTLGKQAAGITVVCDCGHPMDRRTAAIREGLVKALPAVVGALLGGPIELICYLFLALNYLWPLWEPRKRALHDLAAGTHVIRGAAWAGP